MPSYTGRQDGFTIPIPGNPDQTIVVVFKTGANNEGELTKLTGDLVRELIAPAEKTVSGIYAALTASARLLRVCSVGITDILSCES